jgi:hypothetical protein
MNRRDGLWLLWGCGLLLASCDRPADNPQAVKPVPAAEKPASAPEAPGPMSVDSYRKLDLQPGIQLHVWNVRVHALKELTASLLVIRDGKPQTASKTEIKWEKWDDSRPPASGQMLLLMQDGQLFGVKDKRVPLLMVDFPDLRDGTRVASTSIIPIEGDVKGNISTATNAGSLLSFSPGQTHKAILYGELFVPANDLAGASLSPDLDVLIKAASSGRAVVAIILEWVPR